MSSKLLLLIAILLVVSVFAVMPRSHTTLPGVCGPCIAPETPQMKAIMKKWDALEKAAKAAKTRGDWASAEADYQTETRIQYCPWKSYMWVELGLMRDYQGKRAEAFQAYHEGFGIGSHRGADVQAYLEVVEAAARCGLMCEDRGLHADACECYYTAQHMRSLNAARTSPAQVRALLRAVLLNAQSEEKQSRGQYIF